MRKQNFSHIQYAQQNLKAVRKLIKHYKKYSLKSIPPLYINENGNNYCPLCIVADRIQISPCPSEDRCNYCLWKIIWGKDCTDYPYFDKQQTRARLHRLRVFEKVLLKQLSKSKRKLRIKK